MAFPAYIGEKSLAGEGPDRGLQAERKQWSVTRVLTCLRLNELAMLKVICFLVLERSALSPLRERDCHPLRMASTLSGEKLLTGRNREWAPEGKAEREGRQLPTAALLPTCLTCGHCHHAHPQPQPPSACLTRFQAWVQARLHSWCPTLKISPTETSAATQMNWHLTSSKEKGVSKGSFVTKY